MRRHYFVNAAIVVLGLTLLLPAGLQAQATADVNGRVLDQQGAVLPGVGLKLRGQDTGLFRDSISNENGTFNFKGMTPGVYQIEAELPGFKKYQRTNLKLEVGKTVVVDVTLEVGQITDEVLVTAEAPLVDITSKEVGGSIETRELIDLPTTNRNFTAYLAVLPGVKWSPLRPSNAGAR